MHYLFIFLAKILRYRAGYVSTGLFLICVFYLSKSRANSVILWWFLPQPPVSWFVSDSVDAVLKLGAGILESWLPVNRAAGYLWCMTHFGEEL